MNAIPEADPLPIPAPVPLLWALLLLTFFLHLLAMNFVLGGSIIAAIARLRGDERAKPLTNWFGKVMPAMVAAAITFGVAPLLFLQTLYGRVFFASSVLMAWCWLAVIPILIVGYYGTYLIAFKRKSARFLAPVVALLFVAVAFIYSNNMTLMLRPLDFPSMYAANAGGTHLNLSDLTLIPRWLHMLLGALAVAGMIVAIFGHVKKDEWAQRHGTIWFIVATFLNVLTGMWWFGVLPRPLMTQMLTSPWLIGGIVFGFLALALIKRVALSATALVLSLIGMILARDEVRRGMLALAEFRMSTWVEPQWTVIAVFAVLLVAALGTVAWMTNTLRRCAPSPPSSSSLS